MSVPNPLPHVLNLDYIDTLHQRYLHDPQSLAPEWQEYFGKESDGERRVAKSEVPSSSQNNSSGLWQDRVNQLIRAYRGRGHIIAHIHPIVAPPPIPAELDPSFYGFDEEDLDHRFTCETLPGSNSKTLREILEIVRNTYCRSIGVQYLHINDLKIRLWLQERMEQTQNRLSLSRDIQKRILTRLTDAVIFEEFVRKKFLGAKTFSLEGCESLIPLLDLAIEKASEQGVKEIVIGMAHRGRLSVLANIIGKSPSQIFREFSGADSAVTSSSGDVKHHLGYSNDWTTAAGKSIHLSLCFNPSHLEYVNPVALGRVRAKQDRVGDTQRTDCMALLIHGDAALAGEGVTQETLNLSQLTAYTTGGTLHVVVNNQIGFTTSPSEGRSCLYATDVALMLRTPIFHVNGEDPEAVAQCLEIAMDFRREFKRDVFIDMYGYRRWGHNEIDEPSFTQPTLYQSIATRKSVREGYLDHLLTLDGMTREDADHIATERRENLEHELNSAHAKDYKAHGEKQYGIWARSEFHGGAEHLAKDVETGVDRSRLEHLLEKLLELPQHFELHPRLKPIRETWHQMAKGEAALDWAAAETLAYATLAIEGVRVRLAGQDSERGTFSHRHAVLHDYHGNGVYVPLQHLADKQAPVEIFNSPLSEIAALGFEYGFSLEYPDGLVIWEAQFGDFANAAQVIIDQFVASAEDKWRRLSGLVLLLPHGFEGMGPEHSSARIERFLELCANDNMQVAFPSTPAQFFHLLRRQALRLWRKPLVVFTPKSLLRLSEARSSLNELVTGSFQCLIPDSIKVNRPQRGILCSGKIFYELIKHRDEAKLSEVVIIRLEQFYPLKKDRLEQLLAEFPSGTPVVWVQEEPINMGAWAFLRQQFGEKLFGKFPFFVVARAESSSPASGSSATHKREQADLIHAAFNA